MGPIVLEPGVSGSNAGGCLPVLGEHLRKQTTVLPIKTATHRCIAYYHPIVRLTSRFEKCVCIQYRERERPPILESGQACKLIGRCMHGDKKGHLSHDFICFQLLDDAALLLHNIGIIGQSSKRSKYLKQR